MPRRSRASSPALRDGTPLAPSGADGLAALVLAEAAVRSVAEGRRIEVSEIIR